MKKIRLDLQKLAVDSFSTDAKVEPKGTVYGHYSVDESQCCSWSFVCTSCGSTVWEAGCDTITAPLDCKPTEGNYAWCAI